MSISFSHCTESDSFFCESNFISDFNASISDERSFLSDSRPDFSRISSSLRELIASFNGIASSSPFFFSSSISSSLKVKLCFSVDISLSNSEMCFLLEELSESISFFASDSFSCNIFFPCFTSSKSSFKSSLFFRDSIKFRFAMSSSYLRFIPCSFLISISSSRDSSFFSFAASLLSVVDNSNFKLFAMSCAIDISSFSLRVCCTSFSRDWIDTFNASIVCSFCSISVFIVSSSLLVF
mmetsp:Transcript_12526/g.29351  ORF Transcript_12526/g.29351 Transcript_12526/m.29351 type:complete len:238 (-) Transcript_12526:612-1325(-)